MQQVPKEEAKIPLLSSQAIIKLSTFDGKSSWQVYKTQFTMLSKAYGWSPNAKAFHVTASLRGDTDDTLEKLSEAQRQFCFPFEDTWTAIQWKVHKRIQLPTIEVQRPNSGWMPTKTGHGYPDLFLLFFWITQKRYVKIWPSSTS